MHFNTNKKRCICKCSVLKLTSFSCTLSCGFAFAFFSNAWFVVGFFFSDISDDAIFLAFSLKAFESAFKIFVLTNFNRCQLVSPPSIFELMLYHYIYFIPICQAFSCNFSAKAPSLNGERILAKTICPTST